MTLQESLHEAAQRIARRDAELLLTHLLQKDQAWLLAHTHEPLSPEHHTQFVALVARRHAREPIQYITGTQEFYGLPLRVTRDTLIPRPETEHLVEAVLAWAEHHASSISILDVGTGTGAIALALATHLPGANLHVCDLSPDALAVARENAARLGLTNRIAFQPSDLLNAYAAHLASGLRFNIVVSNPPYVPTGDAASLQPEVRDHEPHTALFAGDDGLTIYRRLIPQARAALAPNGLLAMEIGYGQRDALAALLSDWHNVRFLDDYAGIPRVVIAENSPTESQPNLAISRS